MAYGFTVEEEQALDEIKMCLRRTMAGDYDIEDYKVGGFVGYPKSRTATRPQIVKDLVKTLSDNGFTISDVVETRESRSPFTFIRIGDVSINVGVSRRGGQGFYPSTVKAMDDAIVGTAIRSAEVKRIEALKDRIRSKLDPDEIAFLRL